MQIEMLSFIRENFDLEMRGFSVLIDLWQQSTASGSENCARKVSSVGGQCSFEWMSFANSCSGISLASVRIH